MLTEREIREIARKIVEQHLAGSTGAAPASNPAAPPAAQATPAPTAGSAAAPAAPPTSAPAAPSKGARSLALGADHGGYELKEKLKPLLYELGWAVDDCGTYSEAPVDYPTVALAVATRVGQGKATRGIMIDGAGIGSCMAANKVPGVRAALCYDTVTARNSREHNDANVLTLGGKLLGVAMAQEIVKVWLATDCREERHLKRVALITDIERRFSGAPAGGGGA
jgi:ribose 5-phosphate isomerase B